jgi:hypothetical protein
MEIRTVGAELFHADSQMDRQMTKLIAAFRYFRTPTKTVIYSENQK